VALAVRSRMGPRLRWTLGAAAITALLWAAAVALLLPPRGHISDPEYYAHGPDIPRALAAVEDATVSSAVLNEELNAQLVGLARLVAAPAQRGAARGLPRLTLASDLHNNVLALPALEHAARGAPLFFAGDVTDRGTPFETGLLKRVTRAGKPFVFVSGNHDSDTFVSALVRQGAIVLTQEGRLLRGGRHGPVVERIAGLRVAGYSDPSARRAADDYAHGNIEPKPTRLQQDVFAAWLRPLIGKVDVVMVHQEALAAVALDELRANPPRHPIAFLVGHTHKAKLEVSRNLMVMNGGSVGAGGTGNLAERGGTIGLGVLTYDVAPRFTPVAADLVQIDPATGSAKAERHRLGEEIAVGAPAR
jgi:predicted phosphodiesterase